MRLRTLSAIAALALASAAHAGLVDLNLHAGYTSLSMGELNHSNAMLMGWDGAPYAEELNSGIVVGLDATTKHLIRLPWLELGLRAETLRSNQAEMRNWPGNVSSVYTDVASLSSLLVGAKASAPFAVSGLSLGWGAWVGYGYAELDQHVSDTTRPPIQSGVFTAYILVAELESTLSYAVTDRISLNATGGWRWADAPKMKDGNNTDLLDAEQYWENNYLTSVNVDYSGATFQGSVSYSF